MRWRRVKRKAGAIQDAFLFPKGPEPEELMRSFFLLYEKAPAPIAPDALPIMAFLIHQNPPSLGKRGPLGRASLQLALQAFYAMTDHLVPYLLVAHMEDRAILLMADYFSRLHRTAEFMLRAYRALDLEESGGEEEALKPAKSRRR